MLHHLILKRLETNPPSGTNRQGGIDTIGEQVRGSPASVGCFFFLGGCMEPWRRYILVAYQRI